MFNLVSKGYCLCLSLSGKLPSFQISQKLSELFFGQSKSATSGEKKNAPFLPKEIAKKMRAAGPVRIQDADFLHVFEGSEKPEVSGPLAIEYRKVSQSSFIWSNRVSN